MAFIDQWSDVDVEALTAALLSPTGSLLRRALKDALAEQEDSAMFELVSPEPPASRDFLAGKVAGTRHATMAFERCERACKAALARRSGR